jgi:hypothetical protein
LAEFFNRPKNHFYGTYIQGKQGLALWYEWLNLNLFIWRKRPRYAARFGKYGEIVVNSQQNVAATEQYVREIPFSPPDTLNYGWGEAQSALQQGRLFMGLLWNDQAPFLKDPAVSKVAGKIAYSLIPANSSSNMPGSFQPVGRFDLLDPNGIEASARGVQISGVGDVRPGSGSTDIEG